MNKFILLITLLTLQGKPDNTYIPTSSNDFSFFIGEWKGKGEFSNGKPIEAIISFEKSLNGNWIESTHKDALPNTYEALSLWPFQPKEGDFPIYIFDNYGTSRKFITAGWQGNKVVLIAETENPGNWKWQKFIYEKISNTSFKMTFKISNDGVE